VPVDRSGDQPQQRAAVGSGQQLDVAATDVLVAGRLHLVGGREVDPQLEAVEEAAADYQLLGRRLDVQQPGAGRHPLGVAVVEHPAPTLGVLVHEGAVEQIGHGLEAAVRMPGGALGLTGRVLHLTHLVHHDERVQVAVVDPCEGPAHREALTLESAGRRGNGEHGPRRRALPRRRGHTGQREGVLDGDGGHGDLQVVHHST
jgi:hypothetical protein